MRPAPLLAAGLAFALAAPAADALAAQPWGTVETVDRYRVAAPSLAVDDRGYVVLAYATSGSTWAARFARRTPTRGFARTVALRTQPNAISDVQVAFDSARNALVAYRRFVESNHRIETNTIRPGGGRAGAISLSGPGSSAYAPRFPAADPTGRPRARSLLWTRREPGRVQIAEAAGGRLLVSRNDTLPTDVFGPATVQEPDGTIVAATAHDGQVVVAEREPGGRFSQPRPVSHARAPVRDVDAAIGPDGTIAVAWRQYDGRTYRLVVAVREPDGVFGAPAVLSGADERATQPRVVVTARGVVRIAYASSAPGNDSGADHAGRLRLATLGGPTRALTAGRQEARSVAARADGSGGVTVAWVRPGSGGGPVFARAITPRGTVGSRRQLTPRGERALSLALATGTRNDAVAAWVTAGGERLRAIRRPASR